MNEIYFANSLKLLKNIEERLFWKNEGMGMLMEK
jgi:hypothetical protein